MIRVLILIKGLGRGGAEQLIASAARHRDQTRFHYEVAYLLPWKRALVQELEETGIPTTCLQGGHGLGWARRLARLVAERDFGIVHCHSPHPATGARLVLPAKRRRMVYTEHNVWSHYRPLTYLGNMTTFNKNDHVFAVSADVKTSIVYPRALAWMTMPPVETLYHGIDVAAVGRSAAHGDVRDELGLPARAPVVGTVANFISQKRHDVLLRAFARVLRAEPDTRLVMVGIGPRQETMRRLAADLGVADHVVFTGLRDDVPRVIAAFDVFALASDYEGLGLALVEAMAVGKPIVVTDIRGAREVVRNGVEGVYAIPGDADSFADGIISLLSDEESRSRMASKGRIRAADFDIRRSLRRYEEIYEELIR